MDSFTTKEKEHLIADIRKNVNARIRMKEFNNFLSDTERKKNDYYISVLEQFAYALICSLENEKATA